MNIKRFKSLSFLWLIFLLSACTSTSKPVEYYVLESGFTTRYENNDSNPAKETIRLQELHLARYLAQSSLTLLRSDHSVYYTNHHIWAEPLQYGLKRALAMDFFQAGSTLLLEGDPSGATSDFELRLQIDNFSATDDSRVLLGGKFWLLKNEKPLASREFQLSDTLTVDGYAHSVSKQRELVAQLVQLILDSVLQTTKQES